MAKLGLYFYEKGYDEYVTVEYKLAGRVSGLEQERLPERDRVRSKSSVDARHNRDKQPEQFQVRHARRDLHGSDTIRKQHIRL